MVGLSHFYNFQSEYKIYKSDYFHSAANVWRYQTEIFVELNSRQMNAVYLFFIVSHELTFEIVHRQLFIELSCCVALCSIIDNENTAPYLFWLSLILSNSRTLNIFIFNQKPIMSLGSAVPEIVHRKKELWQRWNEFNRMPERMKQKRGRSIQRSWYTRMCVCTISTKYNSLINPHKMHHKMIRRECRLKSQFWI